jgi:hypothetical protein
MEVLVCEEGFIHLMGDGIETEDPNMEVVDVDYDFSKSPIVDSIYGLPLYRYIDEQVIPVQDPIEYQLEESYWEAYIKKLTDEVDDQIKSLSNDEMKAIYDSSPQYKKDVIYKEIEHFEAEKVDQVTFNLGIEMIARIIAEWFYIKEVEQRNPTSDETAGFHQVLQNLRDHNIGMGMPISTTSWFQEYLHTLLEESDALRTETFSKRFYITGRP